MNLGVRQLGWVGRDQKNDPLLCMYVTDLELGGWPWPGQVGGLCSYAWAV